MTQVIMVAYVLFIFLLVIVSPSSTSWFERDEDAGYWFDTSLEDYDASKETAEFKCSLRLHRRNLRPAESYFQVGKVSTNGTIHDQKGDSESSDIIKSGVAYSSDKLPSEPGETHACYMELGDGRKDMREIVVNSLDGAPIVYVETSMYTQLEEVPYGASFYLIYAFLGINVKGTVRFSRCDPRQAGCKEEHAGFNYEENPFKFLGGNTRKIFMRGKAVEAGFYIFKGTSDRGNAKAYYQLKVAEPVPATWSEKSAALTEDKEHSFSEGQNITIPCIYYSPVPYKARFHWSKDGTPMRDSSPQIKEVESGTVLMIEKSTSSDSGEYTCEVEFIDWSEKIKPISKTAKVKVTSDVSGNEPLVQSSTLTAISTLFAIFVAKTF